MTISAFLYFTSHRRPTPLTSSNQFLMSIMQKSQIRAINNRSRDRKHSFLLVTKGAQGESPPQSFSECSTLLALLLQIQRFRQCFESRSPFRLWKKFPGSGAQLRRDDLDRELHHHHTFFHQNSSLCREWCFGCSYYKYIETTPRVEHLIAYLHSVSSRVSLFFSMLEPSFFLIRQKCPIFTLVSVQRVRARLFGQNFFSAFLFYSSYSCCPIIVH